MLRADAALQLERRRHLAVLGGEVLRRPAEGLHRRGRRGDADAQAEAPRLRGAFRVRDRTALLNLEQPEADPRRACKARLETRRFAAGAGLCPEAHYAKNVRSETTAAGS